LVWFELMTETRAQPGRLALELQRDNGVPLHRQLEAAVRDSIRAGALRCGSLLPPTRVLATDLGVSRGVVVEEYQRWPCSARHRGRRGHAST